MYIEVDEAVLKRFRGVRLWVPMLMVECGEGGVILFDCFAGGEPHGSSLHLVLSAVRIADVGLSPSPPVDGARVESSGCGLDSVLRAVEEVKGLVGELSKEGVEAPTALESALSHFLSPVKWLTPSFRRASESASRRIAASLGAEVVAEVERCVRSARGVRMVYGLYIVDAGKKLIQVVGRRVFEKKSLLDLYSRYLLEYSQQATK